MFFRSSKGFKIFSNRVNKKSVIFMIVCTRCASKQRKCRMSSLFRKCEKCIQFEKKCELAHFVFNFNFIDRAMKKLKREELETKIT